MNLSNDMWGKLAYLEHPGDIELMPGHSIDNCGNGAWVECKVFIENPHAIVHSSHGDLAIDNNGCVLARELDSDDEVAKDQLRKIIRFDDREYARFYDDENAFDQCKDFDILDLAYFYTKDGTVQYEPADEHWRTKIKPSILEVK